MSSTSVMLIIALGEPSFPQMSAMYIVQAFTWNASLIKSEFKEYLDGCHNEVLCFDVCCIWHGNPRINVVDVRNEWEELLKLLKKQLIELAKAARVHVMQHVDKKSLQLSKSMMVGRLVAAKFNAALGNTSETMNTIRAEKTVHVQFRLINCIFSDDLSSAACDADNMD